MLHELLLALLGYTGDLIIDERERQESVGLSPDDSISDQCTFKLAPDISFIEPEERDVIGKIITLGFYYRELDRFATKSRNLSWIRSGNVSPSSRTSELLKEKKDNQSVYRRAIANGIVEVLSIYRSAVLHIEQKLLSDSLPILATLTQGLNKFLFFLPPLYELILEIERDDIHGGKLLNLLHKRCHCGVPELQTCVQRLLWHGHQVMYNQLTYWMVYGILHDQHGEFFIIRQQERNPEQESSHTDIIQKMAHKSDGDEALSDWYMGFNISLDMLPEYVPVRVAESILFAGKAIRVLRNPSSTFRSADVLSHQATGPQTFKDSLREEPSLNTTLTADELLPQSEADKIESMLKNLQENISSQQDSGGEDDFIASLLNLSPHYEGLPELDLAPQPQNEAIPVNQEILQENINNPLVEPQNPNVGRGRISNRRISSRDPLTMETMSNLYHLTMKEAAKEAGWGLDNFRKRTRELGIERWPHRKMKSLSFAADKLQESSEFHKRSFEGAIGSIRAIAASHLWQLVVVRADLNGHLKAIKDYFLLAKGDFVQSFLEGSRQLMRLPPRQSTAEADLMVPFRQAGAKTISDDDKYFSRVSLRVNIRSSQADVQKPKTFGDVGPSGSGISDTSLEESLEGWDGISLEYSIDWPLQLFFTQEVLTRYRRIFQYLLRLKRTQMELEKSWESVMQQDHLDFSKRIKAKKTSQQKRQRFTPMWWVREQMVFLIRNLQFYIQVDVIESQWNILVAHIKESRDFTDLVEYHQAYVLALISQSFLDIGSVSRILDGIMKLCLQFCWKIENQESDINMSELERISEEFNKKSNSLYTILRSSRLAGSQRAPFLRRFLLRLNFNSYYEANAQGVMNVMKPPTIPAFLRLEL